MFRDFAGYEDDLIESLFVRLAADSSSDKIDLGIGVYRDDAGNVPVMQAVRQAELVYVQSEQPKSYISPLGNLDYCADMERLTLGEDHPVLTTGRIVSAQTPGAGSALRAGAELVNTMSPGSRVWVSDPVWFHQLQFFEKAGIEIQTYRYYDTLQSVSQIDGMLEDLRAMQEGDLLLLHGCCHNPTGQDLSLDEWQAVTDIVLETGAIPFVDIAYQGFGQGIEEDVAGLRLIASQVPEMLLTVSSSKSFGIYRERAGILSIVAPPDAKDMTSIRRLLRDTLRQLYFMAPNHGAAVVHEILSSPDLEALWRSELDKYRLHMLDKRKALCETLESEISGFDASFILRQFGMFSCLPITDEEQKALEDEFHIYMLPNARVNVAAMSSSQGMVLAGAFKEIRARRPQEATPIRSSA